MFNNKRFFSLIQPCSTKVSNGCKRSSLKAEAIGTARIIDRQGKTWNLHNSLYVPALTTNLLSLTHLATSETRIKNSKGYHEPTMAGSTGPHEISKYHKAKNHLRRRRQIQEQLCLKSSIEHHFSPAYTPQHNGLLERGNRSVIEKARCLLIQSSLPLKFWGEAVSTAAFLCNLIPKQGNKTTPFENGYHQKPPLKHLRPFRCKAWIRIPPQLHTHKLAPVSWEGIFLGYENNGSSYRILRNLDQAVVISRHVFFDEKTFPSIPSHNVTSLSPVLRSLFPYSNRNQEEPTTMTRLESNTEQIRVISPRHPTLISRNIDPANILSYQRRTRTNLTQAKVDEAPKSYDEELSGPNKERWEVAIQTKLENMEKLNVWTPLPRTSNNKPITCTWDFKIKKDATGNPTKYKARLCAQGFWQVPRMDVKRVFLNDPIKQNIAIEVPQGLMLNKNSQVLQLNKAFYGLKKSPLAWHKHPSKWLKSVNFSQSVSDPCVLWKSDPDLIWIYVHVDDLALFGPNLDSFKKLIQKNFKMKDLGEANLLLGITINHLPNGFSLSQTHRNVQHFQTHSVQNSTETPSSTFTCL
ncbi:hypothetical protein O181_024850 [Austropuccinia psidii MF-1]|uniref:Integrase catalytic domain-containing protein n=1 Tax=Austropuccinia psidii MF-1 TaxID=1389203 RepID=A0A9Q3CLB3_9BASI|nr:hypothetical protein [Austropuccinia psidii MF-1]